MRRFTWDLARPALFMSAVAYYATGGDVVEVPGAFVWPGIPWFWPLVYFTGGTVFLYAAVMPQPRKSLPVVLTVLMTVELTRGLAEFRPYGFAVLATHAMTAMWGWVALTLLDRIGRD